MNKIEDEMRRQVYEAIEDGLPRGDLAKVCIDAMLEFWLANPPWIVRAEMLDEVFSAEVRSILARHEAGERA
jgi:cytochrome c-type biogenesis protein CcmH/NrfF